MKKFKETTKDDYMFCSDNVDRALSGLGMCPDSEAICDALTLDDLEKLFDESHTNVLCVNGCYLLSHTWYENSVVFDILSNEPDLELTMQIHEADGEEAYYDKNGEAIMVLDTIEVSQEV